MTNERMDSFETEEPTYWMITSSMVLITGMLDSSALSSSKGDAGWVLSKAIHGSSRNCKDGGGLKGPQTISVMLIEFGGRAFCKGQCVNEDSQLGLDSSDAKDQDDTYTLITQSNQNSCVHVLMEIQGDGHNITPKYSTKRLHQFKMLLAFGLITKGTRRSGQIISTLLAYLETCQQLRRGPQIWVSRKTSFSLQRIQKT